MLFGSLREYWKQLNRSKENAVFRCDPIPHTGRKLWRFRNHYRTACCVQERKLYGDPDHRKYGRGKRCPSSLPDAWNDFPKSRNHGYKSWKRTKKKRQWMKNKWNQKTHLISGLDVLD